MTAIPGRTPGDSPWPFGIEKARRELNLELIQDHAVDVIARAIGTRRLTVFAGAGLTMAYGRMTWGQLLELMYTKIMKAPATTGRGAQAAGEANLTGKGKAMRDRVNKLNKQLWPNEFEAFKGNKGDYSITAQLFADVWTNLAASNPGPNGQTASQSFHQWVSSQLEDHQGRLDQLLERWPSNGAALPTEIAEKASPSEKTPRRETPRDFAKQRVGVTGFIQKYAVAITRTDPRPVVRKALEGAYAEAHLNLLSREESPLDILINVYGVRRFLTTNYDEQIERTLAAFDYPRSEDRLHHGVAAHGTWHKSTRLTKQSTGEAICFAVEGARRHIEVLHVHGSCENAAEIIITESDYQRLYLEEHETRDLLENAIRANFGANPILFVGSNVEEDDIMRPLRQFMTGSPHRRDRMAVALLPALEGDEHACLQALKLYLRFGVHAIHYGYTYGENASDPTAKRCRLRDLNKICEHLRRLCGWLAIENPTRSNQECWIESDALHVGKKYQDAGQDGVDLRIERAEDGDGNITLMEGTGPPNEDKRWQILQTSGVGCPERVTEFSGTLKSFLACLRQVAGSLLRLSAQRDANPGDAEHLRMVVEEIHSGIISLFMCAALRNMHREATLRLNQDRLPARPYIPQPPDTSGSAAGDVLFRRHAVECHRAGYHSWFAAEDPDRREYGRNGSVGSQKLLEPPDELNHLIAQIRNNGEFKINPMRRAIILSAPRGAGKGALFDSLREPERLGMLQDALRPEGGGDTRRNGQPRYVCFHFNLTFSNEIGDVVSQFSRGVLSTLGGYSPAPAADTTGSKDNLEDDQMVLLAKAMDALQSEESSDRCLLLLGNASVLFEESGDPKNGQLRRILGLMTSDTYATSRLDTVFFCSEARIPIGILDQIPARNTAAKSSGDNQPESSADQAKRFDSREDRERRRLQRMNRYVGPSAQKRVLLVNLQPTSARRLWETFFAPRLRTVDKPDTNAASASADIIRLYELLDELQAITGANRMALTLVFAFVRIALPTNEIESEIRSMISDLQGCPAEMAVERVTALVLDRWCLKHLAGISVPWPGSERARIPSKPSGDGQRVTLSLAHWDLVTELLWTLSVISQPVDARVLLGSEAILKAIDALRKENLESTTTTNPTDEAILSDTLELLVHWCLIFRVGTRPATAGNFFRYATHRHLQRHFLRLSGGRNAETTGWDQFTTTLYASQPDELPTLSTAMHEKFVALVKSLSCYPRAFGEDRRATDEAHAERLRAAYSLIRSSFSMGVLARSFDLMPDDDGCGAMEQYRRLVRWVAFRAREFDIERLNNAPNAFRNPVLYAGELVWVYNECGVIALAQGKLDQAEEYMTLAERAAQFVESDNSGSLHARLRLHTALTQIERGRASHARSILVPLSERQGGHPVLPNLAHFYLGLIEHIGGNYKAAERQYKKASRGLRNVGRSRALAFVLKTQAALHYALYPHDLQTALSMADEAVSLAHRGGHIDAQVIASLAGVGLRIGAGQVDGLFDQLDFAQRYATRMDMPRIACEAHELRARLLHRQGETVLSAKEASSSLEIAALYDLKLMKVRAMRTLANIYFSRGDHDGAKHLAFMGKELATAADYFSCVRGFQALELRLSPRAELKM